MREINSLISLFVCLFTKVHSALVVGGVVAFGDKLGDWYKFVALGSYCINYHRQCFGSVGCAVVHKDDASVLEVTCYFLYHFLR